MTALPVGESEIACPEIVIAEPGESVCEPIMKADDGFCVNVEVPIIITGVVSGFCVGVGAGAGVDAGRVMTWPSAVMALPGNRVWLPITKPEDDPAVIRVPPTIITAGAGPVLDVGVSAKVD